MKIVVNSLILMPFSLSEIRAVGGASMMCFLSIIANE